MELPCNFALNVISFLLNAGIVFTQEAYLLMHYSLYLLIFVDFSYQKYYYYYFRSLNLKILSFSITFSKVANIHSHCLYLVLAPYVEYCLFIFQNERSVDLIFTYYHFE